MSTESVEQLQAQVKQLEAQLAQVSEEKAALAAHVERLRLVALEVCNDAFDSSMGAGVVYQAMMQSTGDRAKYEKPLELLAEAALSSPETSFARLIAEKQAEALHSCAKALDECGWHAAAAGTFRRAEGYLRQAEAAEIFDRIGSSAEALIAEIEGQRQPTSGGRS